jgi:hypothetical protein
MTVSNRSLKDNVSISMVRGTSLHHLVKQSNFIGVNVSAIVKHAVEGYIVLLIEYMNSCDENKLSTLKFLANALKDCSFIIDSNIPPDSTLIREVFNKTKKTKIQIGNESDLVTIQDLIYSLSFVDKFVIFYLARGMVLADLIKSGKEYEGDN